MAVVRGMNMPCGERIEAMDVPNLMKKSLAHQQRCRKCKEQQ